MKIVFFGSGAFGLPTLSALLRQHDVTLVVSQPDRPAGRARRLTATPIAAFAADEGATVIKPERVDEPSIVETIRGAADAFVVIAYGHKLGPPLLADRFAINLHASLLPKYRGAAPINWAMIHGETETGVSVITLAQRMDAGDVLADARVAIDPHETAGELHDRLADLGPEVVEGTLRRYEAGTLEPQTQDESLACPAPKLAKRDGTVGFDQPARAVRCRVHGLTPWPGCTVELDGKRLRLLRVADVPEPVDAPPGTVLPGGTVACNPGAIHLLSVQSPGGKAMTFDAYRRGHRVADGARVEMLS